MDVVDTDKAELEIIMVKLPKLKVNHLCQRVLSFPILVDAKTGDTIRDQKRLDEIIRRCTAFEDGGLVDELKKACEMGLNRLFELGQRKGMDTPKILKAALARAQR